MRSTADPTPAASGRPTRFIFVGERRSRRAIRLGVRWEHGRLCARTLHAALRAIGLAPEEQAYVNLYFDAEPPALDKAVLARLRALAAEGVEIVGLGRLVQRALERAGVPHRRLIHPAARGAIRARAVYQAHVASVLGRECDTAADNGTTGAPRACGENAPNGGAASTDRSHSLHSEEAHRWISRSTRAR
ncbi:MAG TPA: hypothetical protein VFE37_20995 [Chloroflexota bacterium]|nr:hypothetical protein [Chloroflexota bacterium]